MNINTYKRTNYSKDYLNLLSSNCATNIIDVPTRVTTSSATVLDHIITNENKHQIFPAVVDYPYTYWAIFTPYLYRGGQICPPI